MTTGPLSSRFSSLSSLPPVDLASPPCTTPRERSAAQQTLRALLVDPSTRKALVKRLHRRVPEQDVDDLVQDVFVAALEAEHVPETVTECTKWLFTIARHKRADYLEGRTLYTNVFSDSPDEIGQEDAAPPTPRSARDQLRWVQRQLESGALPAEVASWMTRQSEGESWAAIGKSEHTPAGTVRERVRYHRQQLRERWLQDSKPPDSKPT